MLPCLSLTSFGGTGKFMAFAFVCFKLKSFIAQTSRIHSTTWNVTREWLGWKKREGTGKCIKDATNQRQRWGPKKDRNNTRSKGKQKQTAFWSVKPALLPLNTICHHVRAPLLSGDSLGVRHAYPLQETQGRVGSHWVVLLISWKGRQEEVRNTEARKFMSGGVDAIKWISVSNQSVTSQFSFRKHCRVKDYWLTHPGQEKLLNRRVNVVFSRSGP